MLFGGMEGWTGPADLAIRLEPGFEARIGGSGGPRRTCLEGERRRIWRST